MAYGCRDVAIILRQPNFKSSQSINTLKSNTAKSSSNRYSFSTERGKTKSNHEVLDLWQRSLRLRGVFTFDVQANFDISNSKGMGKTLRVFRSSR